MSRDRGRRVKRALIGLGVAFAMIGVIATYRFVAGPPGVGHFRSAEGRQAYARAYAKAISAMPEPTRVHDVSTSFGVVRVYEWSTPQNAHDIPVVLVPGRASGTPTWSENLPFLGERKVLAFDLLGDAGMSVQSVPLASFADQAVWMHEVIERLGPRVHLVGHSFGGATAVAYAQQHPGNLVSLTLLDPVFTFAYPPADLMGWTMLSSIPITPDKLREKALGKVGGVEYDPNDPMAQMIDAGSKHFAASLPTPSGLTAEENARLTMPVYVAIAARDSLAGGERAAERARTLPRGTVEVWPDTTHSLPMQVARPLGARLDAFWRAAES